MHTGSSTSLLHEASRPDPAGTGQSLPGERTCSCGSALANALITDPNAVPEETKKKLSLLVGKYLHE